MFRKKSSRKKNSILAENRSRWRGEHIRKAMFRGALPILGVLVLLGGALFLPQLRIAGITVEGSDNIPEESLHAVAANMIDGAIFGFIPKNNILFVRTEPIRSRVLQAYPDIARAQVAYVIKIYPELRITIEERMSVGIFCTPGSEESPMETCFYIDSAGVLFEEAPNVRGQVVTRFMAENNIGASLGDTVLPADTMQTLNTVIADIEEKTEFRIVEIVATGAHDKEFILRTHEGWYMLLDAQEDGARSIENLLLVLEEYITNRKDLAYIDIRLPRKVFFKYKEPSM